MKLQNPDKQYKTTHSMVYSCQYHIIFCPKYRRAVFEEPIAERMKQLIIERQAEYGYSIIEMEVMPDHVHLLLDVNPHIGVHSVIAKIKGYTARTLRKEFPALKSRLPSLWTRSKFISTVGAVSLETVKQYIVDQKGV